MGQRSSLGRLLSLWSLGGFAVLMGCGGGVKGESDLVLHHDSPTAVEDAIEPGLEVAPPLVLRGTESERPTPPRAPVLAFQPGFHQALRWSHNVSSVTTFRMRIPVARTGGRIKVAFRSGDGTLTLQVGEETVELAAGGFTCIPPGVVHTFSNPTEASVRFLNFNTPSGWEHYMRDLGQALADGAATQAEIGQIASRYDFKVA